MHVVIDSKCTSLPKGVISFTTERNALLHFLHALDYNPSNPPFADLLKRYYHLEGEWVVLTPVQWVATHNDAMITALGNELNIQESEARLWFELFSSYFLEEGGLLHYHNSETWLFQNDKLALLQAKPVYQLVSHSLMPELARLDSTLYWQKFLTECQMLFASKPNHSLMNGLWAWGNAPLKEKSQQTICADEFLLPWASLCSTNVTRYHPSLALKDYQVLLLTELSILSELHQKQLKKMPAHWYWNNAVYSQNTEGWLVHLWRKLTHAY